MPQMILDISPELQNRIHKWSNETNLPPQDLAIDLLDWYFDDCDAGEIEAEKFNDITKTALAEADDMQKHPEDYKCYDSFADFLAEIENEETQN
ncbi:MAG: hypothetical protein IJM82_08645 [Synergistaceae bacterium]|nr:hypothetical protein [Synergistaceae bacterium]MBQ7069218.1 hypothetical protein [Synergistaceae bacterium]MBR0080398.1 hypothetical protein [Synergistaceae bacterium]MBR0233010.1 hypothetical protein [Synergistaceae bacterium]MBR0254265.1 hypothetical protein [Synergistaceae bacterium]